MSRACPPFWRHLALQIFSRIAPSLMSLPKQHVAWTTWARLFLGQNWSLCPIYPYILLLISNEDYYYVFYSIIFRFTIVMVPVAADVHNIERLSVILSTSCHMAAYFAPISILAGNRHEWCISSGEDQVCICIYGYAVEYSLQIMAVEKHWSHVSSREHIVSLHAL